MIALNGPEPRANARDGRGFPAWGAHPPKRMRPRDGRRPETPRDED